MLAKYDLLRPKWERIFLGEGFLAGCHVGFGGFLAFAAVFGVFEMNVDSESSSLNAPGVPIEGLA